MKTLFISTRIKSSVNKSKILEVSKKLPENIAIVYSIQYEDIATEVKSILLKNHKITKLMQVLGCSKLNFSRNTNAILLIGSGKFHAISLAFETKLPVYILEKNHLEKISKEDVGIFEKKQKAAYVKFLNSDKIGILISTKPGQQNLKKALDFKKSMSNKKPYLFIANNINTNEFQNFGLTSWVNTACPRLDMESSSIININKVK